MQTFEECGPVVEPVRWEVGRLEVGRSEVGRWRPFSPSVTVCVCVVSMCVCVCVCIPDLQEWTEH